MVLDDEKIVDIILDNGNETIKFKILKILEEKTIDRYKYKILENDSLAFDHPLVIVSYISRIKNKIEYTDIVFNYDTKIFFFGRITTSI